MVDRGEQLPRKGDIPALSIKKGSVNIPTASAGSFGVPDASKLNENPSEIGQWLMLGILSGAFPFVNIPKRDKKCSIGHVWLKPDGQHDNMILTVSNVNWPMMTTAATVFFIAHMQQ